MELQQWVESQGFEVESAQIIRDRSTGMSRGFGFVTMETLEGAEAAREGINGSEINGRVLTVEKVR